MATWLPAQQITSELPSKFSPWLLDLQSMTQAMRRAAKQMTVTLLDQTWQYPSLSEAQYLHLDPEFYTLVREVYLLGDGVNWAYGRTVIPHTLFSGEYTHLLQELDDRPIGDVLFSQPGVLRQQLEIARLDASQLEFQQALAKHSCSATELWGRRAQFHVFNSCLSVSEIIFPEIAAYVEK